MKKTVAFAAIVTVLSAGSAAFADEPSVAYTGGNVNTATVTGAGDYSVVLIKDSDNNIVYVDQNNSSFDSVVNFLIQDSPDVGTYTAVFGSDSGEPVVKSFYIGIGSDKIGDVPMTRLSYTGEMEENSTKYYTAGFSLVTTAEAFRGYSSIKVGYNNGEDDIYGGFPLNEHWTPEISGNGSIMLVFVLDHITKDELPSVSVFLSNDPLGSGPAYVGE